MAPETVPLARRVLVEQRVGHYEARIRAASGEIVPMEVTAVYSTLEGKRVRVAGLRDLRAVKLAAVERRKLQRQIESGQRLQSLGGLAGGIAHDFNNILVGVLGNAELALGWTEEPRLQSALEAILDAGQKAASLTAQMLAHAGRRDLGRPVALDLGGLVMDVRHLLGTRISSKASVQIDVRGEAVVNGDRTTLTQVVLNLFTNASDALEGKPGRIDVRVRSVDAVEPSWSQALGGPVAPGPWVLLQVEDDGVGMDEATVTRIFEPFFSTKESGHGLGLAACLGIIASHGGALRVESEPGKGSRFSALLPAARERVVPVPAPSVSSQPCHVLVVDDQPVVREQLRRSLEASGYRVSEAGGGAEALASVAASAPDVVLMDVTMPGMSGAETVTELRRRGVTVPVVLTSGLVDPGADEALDADAYQAFLRKPYTQGELHAALHEARAGKVAG